MISHRVLLAFVVVPLVAGADEAMPNPPTWGDANATAEKPAAPALKGVPWLQALVDAAPEGSVLALAPGRYSGPVLVNKRLSIEGGGHAVIDGGGQGTVMTVQTSDASVRGLTFTGSGDSHNTDDACLNLRGHRNVIESNSFEDCLFGIDLKQSNENSVLKNHIRSKPVPLGQRGDAIRLWYSMKNRVDDNVITDSRDVVVWYSNGNTFRRNEGRRSRYSIHFMYAQQNVVEHNHFADNSVGIYVMYTDGVEIRDNVISHSTGATGMGIGFKEASGSVVEGNSIVYCGVGIASDLSPYQPDSTVTIRNNRLAYNGVGMTFVGDKQGTLIEGNVFEGNLDQVAQSGGGSANHSVFRGNYWDDYRGFDRNNDGVGDLPYELYAFTDQVWAQTPTARFFKNAPLVEALDFLERLAPFTTPDLLVKDESPLFVKPTRGQP